MTTATQVPHCLKKAILQVWNDIAPDVEDFHPDNEDAIEMCIDADRLVTFAKSQEAKDQLRALLDQFGYQATLTYLASHINLV